MIPLVVGQLMRLIGLQPFFFGLFGVVNIQVHRYTYNALTKINQMVGQCRVGSYN